MAHGQGLLRGAYLQNGLPDEMTIKWRTDTATNALVWYGNSPTHLNQVAASPAMVWDHSVRLTGLTPYTDYYYMIGDSNVVLEGGDSSHRFRTNPMPGSELPIKIWVIGDFGKGNPEEVEVRDAYSRYVAANRPADVWLWLGDNAYDSGTDQQYQDKVFNIYDSIFAFQPFWPTPGNHDYQSINQNGLPPTHYGPYYNIVEVPAHGEAGGLPSGGEMYYSFDYGNVHFVSLNSELGIWVTAPNSPMAQWLVADLQATTQPWKVVYFHQPPHTKGSHDSDNFWEVYMSSMRNNYMPLLEDNGVDLILSGHSHVYERSRLVYGFYDLTPMYNSSYELDHGSGSLLAGTPYRKTLNSPTPDRGSIYAVVGNSGSFAGHPQLNHPMMYYSWGCDSCVGSLVVDVHADTLVGRYYAASGVELDEFAIIKDLTIDSQPPTDAIVDHLYVWPNPFSLRLQISFDLASQTIVEVELVDLRGVQLYRQALGRLKPGTHNLNLDDATRALASGTYLLRLSAGDRIMHEKIVKVNP